MHRVALLRVLLHRSRAAMETQIRTPGVRSSFLVYPAGLPVRLSWGERNPELHRSPSTRRGKHVRENTKNEDLTPHSWMEMGKMTGKLA
jgi:hypothetical protein